MTTSNEHPQTPVDIDATTAHDAYEKLLVTWQQRSIEEVQRPRASVFDAVGVGLKMAQQAHQDREAFLNKFAQFDTTYIDGFRAASLGLWAAETRWRTSRRRDNQDVIDTTVEEAQEARKELLAAADYIWRNDESIKKVISDIRQGAGQRDLADDLQRLADLFRTRWTQASGRSEVTENTIEQAAKLAISLLDEVLQDKQAEALDIRNRAWSHWCEIYEEIHAGGRYIHRRNPDATSLYPSLATVTKRAHRANSEDNATPQLPSETDNNEDPTPAPTPEPTS